MMMSSSSSLQSPNPPLNSTRRRKKAAKIPTPSPTPTQIQWKSDNQQQIYSSKLLQALRQARSPKRVREAADRVLATTARGRTRWSRAILTNRLKLKFMKKNNLGKRQSKVISLTTNRPRKKKSNIKIFRLKSKSLPAVQRKARVLSRLVPGCRKEPFPVVLEEATDYIAALQMQVRAMSALAELLSASGRAASASASASAAADDGGGSSSTSSGKPM